MILKPKNSSLVLVFYGSSSEDFFHQIELAVFLKSLFSLSLYCLPMNCASDMLLSSIICGLQIWDMPIHNPSMAIQRQFSGIPTQTKHSITSHCFVSLKRLSLSVVTLTSRSFFYDKVLRGKVHGIRDKEEKIGELGRTCRDAILCQVSLLRSTSSYALFQGEKWTESLEIYHKWDEVIRKLTKQWCAKGTRRI